MEKKRIKKANLKNSILTGYSEVKDKIITASTVHWIVNFVLQRYVFTFLKLPYVHSRTDQVSKYIVGKGNQVSHSHCQRKWGGARISHVVVTWNWRHPYEFMFLNTYTDIETEVGVHMLPTPVL